MPDTAAPRPPASRAPVDRRTIHLYGGPADAYPYVTPADPTEPDGYPPTVYVNALPDGGGDLRRRHRYTRTDRVLMASGRRVYRYAGVES